MRRAITTYVGVSAFALAASCTSLDDHGTKIDVNEPNDLGVTALETTHVVDHGNNVFTLRGLSADGEQVASVRLTTGTIADLPEIVSGDDFGSEIVVSVAGNHDSRTVTRETRRILYQPIGSSTAFVELPEVSAALAREANVIVMANGATAASSAETAYDPLYNNFTQSATPASDLNAPPKAAAQQTCMMVITSSGSPPISRYIVQVLANQSIGFRYQNPVGPGTGCRASNGISTCAASNCAFGPNGWSTPTLNTASAGDYGFVYLLDENQTVAPYYYGTGYGCGAVFVTSPPTVQYPTVTGTYPSGCSCCSDGSGVCCGSACSQGTCAQVPGQPQAVASEGAWDL